MSSKKYENSNTKAFGILAWISFGIAFAGMLLGLLYLELDLFAKAFLAMTYLFSVSSCFVLAKVVRDKQESAELINKIENAKTEQLLSKYISADREEH